MLEAFAEDLQFHPNSSSLKSCPNAVRELLKGTSFRGVVIGGVEEEMKSSSCQSAYSAFLWRHLADFFHFYAEVFDYRTYCINTVLPYRPLKTERRFFNGLEPGVTKKKDKRSICIQDPVEKKRFIGCVDVQTRVVDDALYWTMKTLTQKKTKTSAHAGGDAGSPKAAGSKAASPADGDKEKDEPSEDLEKASSTVNSSKTTSKTTGKNAKVRGELLPETAKNGTCGGGRFRLTKPCPDIMHDLFYVDFTARTVKVADNGKFQ